MTLVSVWPNPEVSATVTLASGFIITSAGAVSALTDEISGLLHSRALLAYDPSGVNPNPSPIPPTAGGGVAIDSAAELSATLGVEGVSVALLGYYEPGDGGGGDFYWDAASTVPVDGGIVFGNLPVGRWLRRRVSKELNVRWFGAKGDRVHDDTSAIQGAIDATTNQTTEVFVPFGYYKITETLRLTGQADVANPVNGIRLTGEAAGYTDAFHASLIWYGPADGVLLNVCGYDHRISQLLFINDVSGTFGAPVIARCGVALGPLGADPDYIVSAIGFSHCSFYGFEHGVALDLDGIVDHNIEQCYFDDCRFACYNNGVWINGGQPLNTMFNRCVWQQNDPTGANRAPYGCAVRMTRSFGCSLWFHEPNFSYTTYGLKLEYVCDSVHFVGGDSENVKRLIGVDSVVSYNTTMILDGGRYSPSAVLTQIPGYMYDPTEDIADVDDRYIKFTTGNLIIRGATFQWGFIEIPYFRISMDVSGYLISESNMYPRLRPFTRDTTRLQDGIHQYVGKTYSRGDQAVHPHPDFPPAAGIYLSDCPTLNGTENPGGYVTFAPGETTKHITFDKTENLSVLADATTVLYKVNASIMEIVGAPTIGNVYAANLTYNGFDLKLTADPTPGSVKVSYDVWR